VSEVGQIGDNAKAQLRSIIERVENLDGQINDLRSDQKDIFAEAKSNGFDVPALKAIVRARREDADKRRAREEMIDLYRVTLGIE
jgi:uncharacterized protein (UPF0335 family)